MTTVADYMTPGPHTIGREQSLVAAKQMMQKIHVRHRCCTAGSWSACCRTGTWRR